MPRLRVMHLFLWYLVYGHPAGNTGEQLTYHSERKTGKQESSRSGAQTSSGNDWDTSEARDNTESSSWEAEMELSTEIGKSHLPASGRGDVRGAEVSANHRPVMGEGRERQFFPELTVCLE